MRDWVMWPVSLAGRTYASLAEVRADPPAWPELHLKLLYDLLSDSPAFEVKTSGSTGDPKPLFVPKAAAAMSARTCRGSVKRKIEPICWKRSSIQMQKSPRALKRSFW